MNPNEDFHFFAANVYEWVVTKPEERELPDLVQHMEKAGVTYSVWLVPGPWDAKYSIQWYEPKVDGAQCLGLFQPKKVRDANRRKAERVACTVD
jgi:hypothetical protein